MTNLEVLEQGLILLEGIVDDLKRCTTDSYETKTAYLSDDATTKLKEFQNISIRVGKILEHLNISTVVNQYERNFDVLAQASSDGNVMMINLTLPLIRQAKGFLSDPGNIGDSVQLNEGISDSVSYRFMTGDYGVAVGEAFKIFKNKLHEVTGTDQVDNAVGILKDKWNKKSEPNEETRENFEKGISHLLNSMSRFRNTDFHSKEWLVNERQESFYFIILISMCLDILDKYLIE